MRAFNEQLLENTFLFNEAEDLENAGFIHSSQVDLIEKQLPAYQGHTNLLARIGIFILACLVYGSTCGLISFLIVESSNNYTGVFLIYLLVGFTGLELMIRRMKYFANGADDAFLFGAQVSTLCFIGSLILEGQNEFWWPLFLTATLMGIFCSIRYVDSLAALIACLGISGFVINVLLEAGNAGKSFLPFALMLLAYGIYYLSRVLRRSADPKGFYSRSLKLCYVYSLCLFYLASNYFVVREANEVLMNIQITQGEDISLAFLFYTFTVVIPPAYIYVALRKKNRVLLWIGLICLALSIATIRYYFAVMPLEMALLFGGGAIFLIAYLSMKKLRDRINGITFEKDKFQHSEDLLNAEALLLIRNFSPKVNVQSETRGTDFGGGEFGGAGSGDTY